MLSILENSCLQNPEFKPSIYFATDGGGLKDYSLETLETSTTDTSSEYLYAVAYDSIASKVYFSSNENKIYRANMDGSNGETVLSTNQCKLIEYLFQSRTPRDDSHNLLPSHTLSDGSFLFDWV